MKWWVEEDENVWQLFYGDESGLNHPEQVIKAPKKCKEYAEYWPSKSETRFIVDALNTMERWRKL